MRVVIIGGGGAELVMYRFLAYMVAVTTVCCYTQENVLYQITHSMEITVEPKSVVDTLPFLTSV